MVVGEGGVGTQVYRETQQIVSETFLISTSSSSLFLAPVELLDFSDDWIRSSFWFPSCESFNFSGLSGLIQFPDFPSIY